MKSSRKRGHDNSITIDDSLIDIDKSKISPIKVSPIAVTTHTVKKVKIAATNGTTTTSNITNHQMLALLDEFDLDLESRCRQLKNSSITATVAVKNALQVEMIKIPKMIRDMKMSEFLGKYQGDINMVHREQAKELAQTIVAATPARPPAIDKSKTNTTTTRSTKRTRSKKEAENGENTSTSNVTNIEHDEFVDNSNNINDNKKNNNNNNNNDMDQNSSKALETPRRGNRDLVAATPGTVSKLGKVKAAKVALNSDKENPGFVLETEGHGEIDINNENVQMSLLAEEREQAIEELRKMREKMAVLMKKLKKGH